MRPIVLVKQFHKLSRTVEFDSFGFLNLEIFNFKVDISTENFRKFKLEKSTVVDNVEIPDGWVLPVSDSAKRYAREGKD